ncbi:MAG: formylmethanofuran dehydrogenase subunit E family protein [Candidatus Helarchaeota archaeon]|nr:formylmethanofuran dehydrogenase subunit E family protein [Candidatus Helarchaeota archaeon]
MIEFHGHLGPYLIIGLRMGELSNELLGKETGAGSGHLLKKAIIKTAMKPPMSCIIDGIQYISGCTLGKGNIEVIESQKPEATFVMNEKKLTISLKLQINTKNRDLNALSTELLHKSSQDLFTVTKNF